MKNYSYIGISFVILIFGIWAVPKIVDRFTIPNLATIGKVPEFSFTNQNQKTITNKSYNNKVYIVEFFFTTCPSICPIMNKNMVKIQDEFFGNPNLGIASFSIDPTTDTSEVLKEYASQYKLANSGFNLYVGENSEVEGGFEHSGFFALIDQEGNIRSRFDEQGNPIIYYNGLEDEGVQMLKEDIKLLL
mgnify:CR=1 FL=1